MAFLVVAVTLLTSACTQEASVEKDDLDRRYRAALSKQREMNRATWARLQELGVTTATELTLDFFYLAPTEAKARALEQVLLQETDYRVKVSPGDGDSWHLEGSTQPTAITLEILDQWVDWMITAGIHQDCDFDGWGAEVR